MTITESPDWCWLSSAPLILIDVIAVVESVVIVGVILSLTGNLRAKVVVWTEVVAVLPVVVAVAVM